MVLTGDAVPPIDQRCWQLDNDYTWAVLVAPGDQLCVLVPPLHSHSLHGAQVRGLKSVSSPHTKTHL